MLRLRGNVFGQHKGSLNGNLKRSFMSIKYHAALANLLTWQDHYEERRGGVSWDVREVLSQ